MDATTLFQSQADAVGKQLDACFAGLSDSTMAESPGGERMSPSTTLAHLTEAYIALQKGLRGEEHEWGTFQSADPSPAGMLASMKEERARAVAGVVNTGSEKALQDGTAYILLHDAYHVGQLCAHRMQADPDWDAYSIYS
ncbi:MAG: hypothetical protein IT207_01405 [Fimbriimonadaceae bacterium]|nr:hypothetical protein [Fimbriimonadaceae bacterium]